MYRVTVKSRGKHNNTILGARYCFTKHSVISLAITFTEQECEFEVEKFVRLYNDVFGWSDADVSEKIWGKVEEAIDKSSNL